jgi:hypothetical protein
MADRIYKSVANIISWYGDLVINPKWEKNYFSEYILQRKIINKFINISNPDEVFKKIIWIMTKNLNNRNSYDSDHWKGYCDLLYCFHTLSIFNNGKVYQNPPKNVKQILFKYKGLNIFPCDIISGICCELNNKNKIIGMKYISEKRNVKLIEMNNNGGNYLENGIYVKECKLNESLKSIPVH